MIKGLGSPTIAPALEKGSSSTNVSSSAAKKTESKDFATQLFGAKSGKLEGPDRNIRQKPGHESEGRRIDDRESGANKAVAKSAKKAEKPKVESKRPSEQDGLQDRQAVAPIENREALPIAKPIEGERVAEASVDGVETQSSKTIPSKPTDGTTKPNQDVKLPDFFSKAAMAGPLAQQAAPVVNEGAAQTQTAELLALMQQQEQTSRQNAMNEFLTKMEVDLGVPPEKVLQAFSEMDLDALVTTPQNSVGAFVEGLDLDPAGQVKATDLYKNLLDKRGETILAEKLVALDEGVNFDIASPRDLSLRKLDQSLTDLNASFFRKDGIAQNPEQAQQAVETMDAQIARLMRERGDKSAKQGQSEIALMGAAGLGAAAAAASQMKDGSEAASMAGDSGSTLSSMTMSAGELPTAKLSEFGGDQASNDSMGGQGQSNQSPNQAPVAVAKQNVEFKDTVVKEMKTADKAAPSLRAEAASVESAPLSSSLAAGQTSTAPAPVGAQAVGPAAMMMNQKTPSAAEEQQNIREMIKQAQVMLKRGGGEMKIEMTPEGMGQVQLKVAVENGQVNVQMLTESESAKRLLEKGLGDLKASMAAQQLKVENVRVDVGQEIQKHMDHQANQEQARNFAQDFMQQNRDERQAFRDNMFSNVGFRSYGASKRAPLEPDAVQGASVRSASAKSGRSLNLVA